MGLIYMKLGKNKDALESLKKAILADPDYLEARFKMGMLLLDMGK